MDEMEMTVAYHCAPALAGIKPSNLVSFCGKKHPGLDSRLAAWNEQLNPKSWKGCLRIMASARNSGRRGIPLMRGLRR